MRYCLPGIHVGSVKDLTIFNEILGGIKHIY